MFCCGRPEAAFRGRRATVHRDRGLLPESSRTRGARSATLRKAGSFPRKPGGALSSRSTETRDHPTLKSKGATSLPWAGNPKRRGLTAALSRGVGNSCDDTADYLLEDCGSVVHCHQATTGTTSPKREAWAACRNWDHGERLRLFSKREGRHVISVRRHLTKNRPGLSQKSEEILLPGRRPDNRPKGLATQTARPASEVVRDPTLCSSHGKGPRSPLHKKWKASHWLLPGWIIEQSVNKFPSWLSDWRLCPRFLSFPEDAMSHLSPLWTVQASLLPFSSLAASAEDISCVPPPSRLRLCHLSAAANLLTQRRPVC